MRSCSLEQSGHLSFMSPTGPAPCMLTQVCKELGSLPPVHPPHLSDFPAGPRLPPSGAPSFPLRAAYQPEAFKCLTLACVGTDTLSGPPPGPEGQTCILVGGLVETGNTHLHSDTSSDHIQIRSPIRGMAYFMGVT